MLCNNTVTIADQNYLAASGTASEAVAPHNRFCLQILRGGAHNLPITNHVRGSTGGEFGDNH
jgi:hypothetical protein